MSKQSDALKAYFDAHGVKQRDLAERLGLHEGTVSSILSGRYGISKGTAAKLAETYGFDVIFLMTGEGSLFAPGARIRTSQSVSGTGNIVNGAGTQTITGDAALAMENAQLRDQLEKCREEKDRLLGIIETLTKK